MKGRGEGRDTNMSMSRSGPPEPWPLHQDVKVVGPIYCEAERIHPTGLWKDNPAFFSVHLPPGTRVSRPSNSLQTSAVSGARAEPFWRQTAAGQMLEPWAWSTQRNLEQRHNSFTTKYGSLSISTIRTILLTSLILPELEQCHPSYLDLRTNLQGPSTPAPKKQREFTIRILTCFILQLVFFISSNLFQVSHYCYFVSS